MPPLAYADEARVKSLTGIDDDVEDGVILALNHALSRQFTEKVNRTFGLLPADLIETRTVPSRGGVAVRLDVPVRSITSIEIDAVVLDPAAYELVLDNREGEWRAIQRIDGEDWPVGTLAVEADWADLVASVPDDVRHAVTVLVAGDLLDARTPPSSGLLGADGLETAQRTRWDHPTVRHALATNSIAPWIAR